MRVTPRAGAAVPAPALALALALALGTGGLACAGPGPIVDHHLHVPAAGSLAKVAVVPFYPRPAMERSSAPGGVSAAVAAELVSRFVTEALESRGVRVVPPSDLVIAFEGEGLVLPRQHVPSLVSVAARDFGATSVLLGEVVRYREREGSAAGARRPASVWFEVTLHAAPGGERLYSARFEQTQPALSENPLLVRQYPGGGTRWLSAGELARWGAEEIVAGMPEALE